MGFQRETAPGYRIVMSRNSWYTSLQDKWVRHPEAQVRGQGARTGGPSNERTRN